MSASTLKHMCLKRPSYVQRGMAFLLQRTRSKILGATAISDGGSQKVDMSKGLKEAPALAMGTRLNKSPYFDATIKHGVKAFTVYNHMLMPSFFSSAVDEYWRLIEDVCMWDVAAERQVMLEGPDAAKLLELLTPRDMTKMKPGQCKYALITNKDGYVINDPVVLKFSDEKFWLSIADGDLALWCEGMATGLGLDVDVTEPDVSPLAVQGPKSTQLIADLFGDWVHDLKYFNFKDVEINGIPITLARSGWSPERGYELYLRDGSRGDELWEIVWEAGQKYNIGPGAPNQIRRLEGGMLSFGSDIPPNTLTALDLRLPKHMVKLNKKADFVGKAALQKIQADGGCTKAVVGIRIDCGGQPLPLQMRPWPVLSESDEVGAVTSVAYSPRVGAHIGLAMVPVALAEPGTKIDVDVGMSEDIPHNLFTATVEQMPFLPVMSR